MSELVFEWDEVKARSNVLKHGVGFDEAKSVFNDKFALTIPDFGHSSGEERWLDIGISDRERLLVVWYTERQDHIRIIGCRMATNAERRYYENEQF
ncbi:MAG: BrnT family toxin [Candidatus Hydrogenedentes bacterium]|nr:BrnT family toxin [Candidatus Hydrogenedentota bacterium]